MRRDFPLSKLIIQILRQFAKPMSEKIVNFGKRHEYFRYYGLIVPGRIYNHLEVKAKIYIRNDGSNNIKEIQEIEETKALDIGGQLVLEALVFLMLAGFLVLENNRTSKRNELVEQERKRELMQLQERKAEVTRLLSRQAEQIHELRDKINDYSLKTRSSASTISGVSNMNERDK